MSNFTEEQLAELEAVFGIKRQDSLPVRDGRVTRDSMVWWRGDKQCLHVKAGIDWDNIRLYPHIYQLAQPEVKRIEYRD